MHLYRSFSHSLRKFNQPSLARSTSADAGRTPSSDNSDEAPQQRRQASEPMSIIPRSWKRSRKETATTDDHTDPSQATSTLPLSSKVENPTSNAGIREMPPSTPLPAAGLNVLVTDLSMVPHTEVMPVRNPVSDTLAEIWDADKDGPNDSNMSRRLNAVDDAVASAQGNIAPFTSLITVSADAVEQSKIAKRKIDKFFEGMPIFMDALDAVAALHPFIGVVVMAFKTVCTLEMKRRDNEKKIIALYVEMRDMMDVLLILNDVPPEHDKVVAPDGRNIADRLTPLIERTADDIKLCSNACDTYAKKKLLAKVVQGPLWDDKLLSYVTLFSKWRQKIEFELSIYTSRGVDKANAKLDTIGDQTRSLDEKMNVMIAIFQQLVSPKQKQLSEFVGENGGVNILRINDKLLLSLEETASKLSGAPSAEGHRVQGGKTTAANRSADDLRKEIFEEPDAAAEKNWTAFLRKFDEQKRQIIDDLTRVIERGNDRVIQEVKSGPHDRILNDTIHKIWAEMGWHGSVKARHFVLALRDHYLEMFASEAPTVRGMSSIATVDSSQNSDAWAIKFINVMQLQPIMEAFDDDASGFITITEMNRFTSSRPVDWSLPHWIAFWAVGYRSSIIDYAEKMENLFAKMEGVRADVLPTNREHIDNYFASVWWDIHRLTAAVHQLRPRPDNLEKLQSYLETEETRLSDNLKAVDYIIDGSDTLTLITGVGRIEKTVFPLLYLLMKHHYEIMRIMWTKVLDPRELRSGVESISFVRDAIQYRVDDLAIIFSQQKLDPKKQFQNFAYGIFKYYHDETTLWSVDHVANFVSTVIPYDDASEDEDVKPKDILKYETTDELALDYWVYDAEDVPSYRDVQPPLKDLLGHWHGYFYEEDGIREASGTDTMITFVLEPADGEQNLKANAWSNRGRYTISGSWSKGENDVIQIKFQMLFPDLSWPIIFNGHFDPDRDALTGVWGTLADPDNSFGQMEFRRIQPRYLTVYPSIKELSDNKPWSLWRFAIAAVRNDIRRDRWSWSYFSQRRDDRKTFISFSLRSLYVRTALNKEEFQQFCAAALRLTPADACFYGSQINHIRAQTPVHKNIYCDSCLSRISGARLLCLDCASKNTVFYESLDLCCAPQCVTTRVTNRKDLGGTHEPNHRLVKFRTVVQSRQRGRVYAEACAAFERVEDLCRKIATFSKQPQKRDTGLDVANASRVVDTSPRPEDETLQNVTQAPGPSSQTQEDSDLPTCGKCNGSLSFPCWYCIACEGHLFICDTCDAGAPDLTRSSGEHTDDFNRGETRVYRRPSQSHAVAVR
ncbi:hypothetical protein BJV78DRAFT_266553 [Lactifluus subvellereus]|nr:hypothetical protein BJV78DRAFT_266553 [Lactifluus subvellereus]